MTCADQSTAQKQIVNVLGIKATVGDGIGLFDSSMISKRTECLSEFQLVGRLGEVHIYTPCNTSRGILMIGFFLKVNLSKNVVALDSVTLALAADWRYPFDRAVLVFFLVFEVVLLECPVGVDRSQAVITDILDFTYHISRKARLLLPVTRYTVKAGVVVKSESPVNVGKIDFTVTFLAIPPDRMPHYEILMLVRCQGLSKFRLGFPSIHYFTSGFSRENTVSAAIRK